MSIIAMMVMALLFTSGRLELASPYDTFARDLSDWLSKGLTFVFLVVCLMISTSYLQWRLVRVINRFREQIQELRTQRQASEKLRVQMANSLG